MQTLKCGKCMLVLGSNWFLFFFKYLYKFVSSSIYNNIPSLMKITFGYITCLLFFMVVHIDRYFESYNNLH